MPAQMSLVQVSHTNNLLVLATTPASHPFSFKARQTTQSQVQKEKVAALIFFLFSFLRQGRRGLGSRPRRMPSSLSTDQGLFHTVLPRPDRLSVPTQGAERPEWATQHPHIPPSPPSPSPTNHYHCNQPPSLPQHVPLFPSLFPGRHPYAHTTPRTRTTPRDTSVVLYLEVTKSR